MFELQLSSVSCKLNMDIKKSITLESFHVYELRRIELHKKELKTYMCWSL